jgi:hypothetical protein
MNQILLQNIKDSSYFCNGVFNNEEYTAVWPSVEYCPWCQVSAKISKFKLKQVYATKNTTMHSKHLSTYGNNQSLL